LNGKIYGCFLLLRFIYLRESRERDRGRGRENLQADSLLSAEPDAELNPRTLRS